MNDRIPVKVLIHPVRIGISREIGADFHGIVGWRNPGLNDRYRIIIFTAIENNQRKANDDVFEHLGVFLRDVTIFKDVKLEHIWANSKQIPLRRLADRDDVGGIGT